MAFVFLIFLICQMSINIPPPPPVSSRFSSISLTRRPIMQGQRPGGNPPFACKIFASDRAYACEVISRVYAKRTRKIALYTYALLVNIATGGQIPWQRPVFYHFLVNNSNFFVSFMPMLPKNMSPITV